MQAFIATSGEYSDYTIRGVFETQKQAVDYVSNSDFEWYICKIELWEDTKCKTVWEVDSDWKIKLYWECKE